MCDNAPGLRCCTGNLPQVNAPLCARCPKQGSGCGNGQCSGCGVHLDFWQCSWCANDRTSQKAWALGMEQRDAALRSGEPVIPPSGNFNFSTMGAWQPYGRPCTLNNNPSDFLCPPGMHSCQVAPQVWSCVPNNVPCGAVLNAYNEGAYVNAVYDVGRTMPFARPRGGMSGAYPVLNPYRWPPPFNPISDLYRR